MDFSMADLAARKSRGEMSRMRELAHKILEETDRLETYLTENELELPTFDVNGAADFPELPPDILISRNEIIYSTKELGRLAHGPRESLRWGIWDCFNTLALAVINHFGIAKLVPLDGSITLSELQTKTPLDRINLARCLRTCIANGIFKEPEPGIIQHNAASRVLSEDENLQAWIGFNGEDIFPAAAHVLDAVRTYPEANILTRTGFNFANNTVDVEPLFVTFNKDPVRARRMGLAMASLTGGKGYEPKYLMNVEGGGYNFSDVDAAGGTLVDIGGSHGFIEVDLARIYKQMKFIVQDLPKTVESAPQPIDQDPQIASRITFQAHDFFKEQPVKNADVYFFRWIFHNYSNQYAVKLLKNLVPALKPGARILINDHCLREPGQENPWDEWLMRQMDLVMMSLLNAQERTEEEFRQLFKEASDGFVFLGVTRPKGSRMSIIEAVWRPGLPGVGENESTSDNTVTA